MIRHILAGVLVLLFSTAVSATVHIRFNQSLIEIQEGSPNFSFKLVALGDFDEDFYVTIQYEEQSANHQFDFYPLSFRANFTVGSQESSEVKVLLTEDNAYEGQELFKVGFEIPKDIEVAAMKGSPSSLIVAIMDDDNVFVSFDSFETTVSEGAGDVVLRLKSKNPYTVPFRVHVQCLQLHPIEAKQGFRDRVVPNADFIVVGDSTVSFTDVGSEESTSTPITIRIVDDRLTESSESFLCFILKPFTSDSGITVRNPDTITVSILDNDFLQVQFERLVYSGLEGGSVDIQLQANGEFDDRFSASLFVRNIHGEANEAQPGRDYLDPRESQSSGIVDFEPSSEYGKLSSPHNIPLFKDGVVELVERFSIGFTIEPDEFRTLNIKEIGNPAVVTIGDRDEMLVRFSQSSYTVSESDKVFEVTLEVVQPHPTISGEYVPAKHSVEVKVSLKTQDGTAISGLDYDNTEGVVTFFPGMTTSTPLSIRMRNNGVPEGVEDFSVQLEVETAWKNRVKVLESETTVSIHDDDFSKISFEKASYNTVEGSVLELYLVAEQSFQDTQRFDISYINGTAFVGEDFKLLTQTVRLRKGRTRSDVIRVQIVENEVTEDDERFQLSMSIRSKATTAGALFGDNKVAEIFVEDNDKVTIEFPDPKDPGTVLYTVGEGDGEYLVDLAVKEGTVFKPFKVTVRAVRNSKANATAKEWTDYYVDGSTNVLQFNRLDVRSSKAVIRIVDDYVCEGPETFSLMVTIDSDTAEKVQFGEFDRLPITIIDNEGPCVEPDVPVLVSWDTDLLTAVEDKDPHSIRVIRLGKLEKTLTVQLRTDDLTATLGEDYTLSTDEVVFTKLDSVFETIEIKLTARIDSKEGEDPEGLRIILDAPDHVVYQQRDISIVITDN